MADKAKKIAALPRKRKWKRWAFVFFVLAAVGLGYMCISVVQVVSWSMWPEYREGDRVVISKAPYWFGDIERWDVVAFEDPTDSSKMLLKRVIGLPGERIRIYGGDIHVDGKTLLKSADMQKRMWIHDRSWKNPDRKMAQDWEFNGNVEFPSEGIIRLVSVPGLSTSLSLRSGPVDDRQPDSDQGLKGGYAASDFRLDVEMKIGKRARGLDVKMRTQDGVFMLFIPTASSGVGAFLDFLPSGERPVSIQRERGNAYLAQESTVKVDPDSWVTLQVSLLDGTFSASINGVAVLSGQYKKRDDLVDRIGPVDRAISIEPSSGSIELRSLEIARDIHYLDRDDRGESVGEIHLGDDEYYLLGDNSGESIDSRQFGPVKREQVQGRVIWKTEKK